MKSKVKPTTIKTINRGKKIKKIIAVTTAALIVTACTALSAGAFPIMPVTADFGSAAKDKIKLIIQLIGGGVGLWGVVNLLEGYGSDNPGSKSQGLKQTLAGVGLIACASLADSISWNV